MQRLISHPITLLVFTILSIIFFISLDNTGKKRQQSAEIIANNEAEIREADERVARLEEEVEFSETSFAKEIIIRNDLLGVKKDGEYTVQLPDLKPAEEIETGIEAAQTPWEQWKELLFG